MTAARSRSASRLSSVPSSHARGPTRSPTATTAPAPAKPAKGEPSDKDDAKKAPSTKLSPADVRQVVASHQSELNQCYAEANAEKSGLVGKIQIRWFITNRGVVIQVKVVENTTQSTRLAQCVVAALKKWTFAAHSGAPIEITFPFEFGSK